MCIRCCFSNFTFFQFGSKSPHQFYDLDRYQWHKTRCLLSHLTPSPNYASKPYVNTIIIYYVLPYLDVDKKNFKRFNFRLRRLQKFTKYEIVVQVNSSHDYHLPLLPPFLLIMIIHFSWPGGQRPRRRSTLRPSGWTDH